jgi:hypothetical protein
MKIVTLSSFGGGTGGDEGHIVLIWCAESGKELQSLHHRSTVTALAGKTFSRIEFVKITSLAFCFVNLATSQMPILAKLTIL